VPLLSVSTDDRPMDNGTLLKDLNIIIQIIKIVYILFNGFTSFTSNTSNFGVRIGVFTKRCQDMTKESGYQTMDWTHRWMVGVNVTLNMHL
jgi:hypothetical protein